MKITVKLKEVNSEVVGIIENKGISARPIKGGLIIELPLAEKQTGGDHEIYDVPMDIVPINALFLINCEEKGGGEKDDTGSGIIVCGLSGKALHPYLIRKRGHLACREHAFFTVPSAVITITSYQRDGVSTIQEHRIVGEGKTAYIQTKNIWIGEKRKLPQKLNRFSAAVDAALEKSDCYHCRHVHYAVV